VPEVGLAEEGQMAAGALWAAAAAC